MIKGKCWNAAAGDGSGDESGTESSHSERNEETRQFACFRSGSAQRVWRCTNLGHRHFPKADRAGAIVPLAERPNAKGALPIRADAEWWRDASGGHGHEVPPQQRDRGNWCQRLVR